LKLTGKKLDEISIVTNGAGASGIAVIRLLISLGLKNVVLCDRDGAIFEGRANLNSEKEDIAKITNLDKKAGTLADMLVGADAFIGLSAPNCVTRDMVRAMAKDPIIFAMCNPTPEIMPDLAKEAGAKIVGTGRSDFANQINNVLAFPGVLRGALDVRASDINDAMKVAAALAIADFLPQSELGVDNILPYALDRGVGPAVGHAVAQAARDSGVARI
jgi:malate dehydrogenase (oxaloacetate-decarboxylating)